MAGKYPCDLVLMDFFPTGASERIVDVHKAGMKIAGKSVAVVEDECYTVVAVARRVEDLSRQAHIREKRPAVFQIEKEIVFLYDRNIRKALSFEEFGDGYDEIDLWLQDDQFYALVF